MNFRIPTLVVFAGLAATSAGQLPARYFDAPLVVMGTQEYSIIDLLDYDGNGVQDYVVARVSGSALFSGGVMRNPGDGSLVNGGAGVNYYALPIPANPEAPATATGSLGVSDARDDVILAYYQQVDFVISGGFQQPPAYFGPYFETSIVRAAAIGDFDGDGSGDGAILTDTLLTIYRFNGLGPPVATSIAIPPGSGTRLIAGEMTGDNRADVAIGGLQVRIYSLAGNAIVAGPVLSHAVPDPMPVLGDIDNDGDQDLVIFGMLYYQVLRRSGPAMFAPENPGAGGPATHLADIDGDGDLDGACCSSGGPPVAVLSQPATFRVSINRGSGDFAPAFEFPGVGAYHLAGVADVNQDGIQDLVAGRCLYMPQAPLAADPWQRVPGMNTSARTVADAEQDGDPDLGFGLDAVWRNAGDGTGGMVPPVLLTAPPSGTTFAGPGYPGDWNGDGTTDLIVEHWAGPTFLAMRLLANSGGGLRDDGDAVLPGIQFSAYIGTNPGHTRALDFDGDGDQDLLTRPAAGPPYWTHVWLNDGSGHFIFGLQFPNEIVVYAGDLTGDGITDVLVSDGRLMLRRGLAGGTFAAAQALTTTWGFSAAGSFNPFLDVIAIGDITGDQRPDILGSPRETGPGTSQGSVILINTGFATALFGYAPLSSVGDLHGVGTTQGAGVFLADVNADGIADGIVKESQYATVNSCSMVLRTSAGYFNTTTITHHMFLPRDFVDIDGDGDLDAIGPGIVKNITIAGSNAGRRQQFADGFAGTAGLAPTLGATGPFRPGQSQRLTITGGLGGEPGLLAIGTQAAQTPLPGAIVYLIPLIYLPIQMDGPAGVAGAGSWHLDLGAAPPSIAGQEFYLQAGVTDLAGPMGISFTNPLRVGFGI